jgi:DNA-directed RNA polymerase specialized sigma24 family protein
MILAAGAGLDADLDTATASDEALVRLAGRGDRVAHAELWLRHGPAVRAVARRAAVGPDADVVVEEAFARTELALRRGLPTTVPFRLHAYETVREVAAGRAVPVQPASGVSLPGGARAAEPAPEQSPLARAFRSLPALWRSTLWYLDVERDPAASVALWAGVPLADLAVVGRTARAALRRSWVHAQACAWGSETPCATTAVRISRYLRGQLRTEQKGTLEAHLAGCDRCSIVLAEYPDVAQRLELVLLPGVLGAEALEQDDAGAGGPPAPGPVVPEGPAAVRGPALLGADPADLPLSPPHPARRRARRRRHGGGGDSPGSCARRRCP